MPATTVRQIKPRSLGSRTRLSEQWAVPSLFYWSGSAGRHLQRRPFWTLGTVSVLAAIFLTGSLAFGTALGAGGFLLLSQLWFRKAGHATCGRVPTVHDLRKFAAQRHKVVRRWELACDSAKLGGKGGRSCPTLRKVRPAEHGGLVAWTNLRAVGHSVQDAHKGAHRLAEVLGAKSVTVTERGTGIAQLDIRWTDPLRKVLPLRNMPIAAPGRLAYGVREDGETAADIDYGRGVLVAGSTGGGKSSILWSLIADANRQRLPLRIYASDMKKMELKAMRDALGQHGTLDLRAYENTLAGTETMIAAAAKAMAVRQHELTGRKWTPSERSPLTVILLDEILMLKRILNNGTDSPLGEIAYTGRAAGYVIWGATQTAVLAELGRVRDLLPQRITTMTVNAANTDAILGDGSTSNGATAHLIEKPGLGFSKAENERRPSPFRGAMVTDHDIRSIVRGEIPRGMVTSDGRMPVDLYRGYDDEGRLIFVSLSAKHEAREWWPVVTRVESQLHADRATAEKALAAALVDEDPLHSLDREGGRSVRESWDATLVLIRAALSRDDDPSDEDDGLDVIA